MRHKARFKIRTVSEIQVPKINSCCLKKIISGGQIGVDIAGLKAAKKSGFKTGGYMPSGFLTLEGTKPGYSWMYGLRDTCPDYKSRTWKNVATADATLRLAVDFDSKGERCTLNAIRHFHKPSLDIYLEQDFALDPAEVAVWLKEKEITVLNIAGNANKELEVKAEAYLLEVLYLLKWG